jgi:predicted RNA binding protein YcfA (HicA-like mRNA interferase family)
LPRLVCTYERFLEIIEQNGFALLRHDGSSHRRYRGVHSGQVWLVDLSPHNWKDEIPIGTLKSMIRQCGLHHGLFRK